ncbi:SPFH domain-containing protein [Jiulongibacter sediminis]|uniref:Stomatin 2 n=1 Tax=Jiulongibacter sediminis TaxID=1605367 RepID=A0A0P7C0I0_9BACT|nr:stomatin-like protein [Jiulongibacter sediminis]KPM47509.1 stomatin 2 [Jiulongibacter sediminis]TBX23303.1 stomatin 2 [Jiulongibacter sediminis]
MIIAIAIVVLLVLVAWSIIKVVPQQKAYIIERLGKYHSTLQPGINFVAPFVDRVAYKHSLKEQAYDIHEQVCITKDNVQVKVDGVIFLQVVDPHKASYGINDYVFAVTQLAQTTMRSEIGKIDLDKTFVERMAINQAVVAAIDEAAIGWGVKVLRYEIRNIDPPQTVLMAMEKQMQAEREKRAVILESEGRQQSAINIAEGEKQRVVLNSEAQKLEQINNAEGEAAAILSVADATAESIRKVAEAINSKGGMEAVQLQVAEQYIEQFGKLAKEGNTLILPSNLTDVGSVIASAMTVIKQTDKK